MDLTVLPEVLLLAMVWELLWFYVRHFSQQDRRLLTFALYVFQLHIGIVIVKRIGCLDMWKDLDDGVMNFLFGDKSIAWELLTQESSSYAGTGGRLGPWLESPRRLTRTVLVVFNLFDSARLHLTTLGAHEMAAQVQAAKDLLLVVASVAALNCLILGILLSIWWFKIASSLAHLLI